MKSSAFCLAFAMPSSGYVANAAVSGQFEIQSSSLAVQKAQSLVGQVATRAAR